MKLLQNISGDIVVLPLSLLLLLLCQEGVQNRENELGDGFLVCSGGSNEIMTINRRLG